MAVVLLAEGSAHMHQAPGQTPALPQLGVAHTPSIPAQGRRVQKDLESRSGSVSRLSFVQELAAKLRDPFLTSRTSW